MIGIVLAVQTLALVLALVAIYRLHRDLRRAIRERRVRGPGVSRIRVDVDTGEAVTAIRELVLEAREAEEELERLGLRP